APSAEGNFTNKVVITGSNNSRSTNRLSGAAALPPVAAFSGSPTSGLKPLVVTFTDTSTGTITNRFWDFGDGSTTNTSATTFAHTYVTAGTNTISLTVSGPLGVNNLTRNNYIASTNLPPLLVLSPTSLDFGTLVVGQTNTQNFQLVNSGDLPLTG